MKKSLRPTGISKELRRGIPKVIVNATMSLDGRISTRSQCSKQPKSSPSKRPLCMKGVMMGFTGGKSPVPIRILVNELGRFEPKSMEPIFADSGSLLLLCTAKEIPDRFFRQLPPFVRVVEFPGGKIPMDELLTMLRSVWEIKLLLCEGEPSLLKPLFEADAVEEIYLTILPVIQGGSHGISLTGYPDGFLPIGQDRRFRLKSLNEEDASGAATIHYVRDKRKTKH